jgi:hypothetical protein
MKDLTYVAAVKAPDRLEIQSADKRSMSLWRNQDHL